MDTLSLAARTLLPMMLKRLPDGDRRWRWIAAMLRAWSGAIDRDRPEPLIWVAWMRAFNRAVYGDELGADLALYWSYRPLFIVHVLSAAAKWCDDVTTPEREDCGARLAASLDTALDDLSSRFGAGPDDWRWGEAHRARFPQRLFERIPLIGWLASPQIPAAGGCYTLNRGANSLAAEDPYASVHGAGFRADYNFPDLRRSRFMIAPGQSGNPLSPQYADLLQRWQEGGALSFGQSRQTLEREAAARLVLLPQGSRR